jgi:hypothetical protein
MNKIASMVTVIFVGLVALAVAGPALVRLLNAVVPLVIVLGVLLIVGRVVWYVIGRDRW